MSVDFLIGGTDEVLEGQWVWAPNGLHFTYGNWRPGNSDNYHENENCLEIVQYEGHIGPWNDGRCSYEGHYICEMEKVYKSSEQNPIPFFRLN